MPSETTTAHSLLDLTQTLVRIPSCTGHDSPESVLEAIGGYLTTSGIENFQILRSDRGEPLAAWGLIECGRPGPTYLLNAPADTAPAGDVSTWLHSVLGGDVDGGWLYGRGSADSKAGIAVFCHVAREIRKLAATLRGRLLLVFDADEHSGGFEGIKRAVLLSGRRSGEAESPLAGACIGYPGHDRVIVGCRGFFRAIVSVHGVAAHSGASKRQGVNAIARAVKLMEILDAQGKDSGKSGGLTDADFPLPPTVSVTAIHGGEGFSTVPDLCTLNIDCRLTPHADRAWADRRIAQAVATLDLEAPDVPRTQIERLEGWPAYRLVPDAPIVEALQLAARRVLGRTLPMDIAGPSSVGNLGNVPFLGSSKNNSNASVYYSKGRFDTRFSMVYRSNFLSKFPQSPAFVNTFTEGSVTLDASTTITLLDHLSLTVTAINLTQAARQDYLNTTTTFLDYYTQPRTIVLALRGTL